MICSYPVNFNPIRYFFGDGYTIQTRMCEAGGNEIHVQATKPVRKACLEIIESIGGIWWTGIEPENKKAINLCLKCGFKYIETRTVTDQYSGDSFTLNIYKRS